MLSVDYLPSGFHIICMRHSKPLGVSGYIMQKLVNYHSFVLHEAGVYDLAVAFPCSNITFGDHWNLDGMLSESLAM